MPKHFRPPSKKEEALLQALLKREGFGLDLAQRCKISRGTVYVTLSRLEVKGYVVSRQETREGAIGLPIRIYAITELGKRLLEALKLAQEHLNSSPRPRG